MDKKIIEQDGVDESAQEKRQREALARQERKWRRNRGFDVEPTDILGHLSPSELHPNEDIGYYDDN